MPGLDSTYRSLILQLPAAIREFAEILPYRLGLTRSPGVGWDALVLLELNREPTSFAAENPVVPGLSLVSEEILSSYRRAHHCCAIYWMIGDAVADRTVGDVSPLPRLQRILLRSWLIELTHATGDPVLVRREVRSTLNRIANARCDEQKIYGIGTLSPSRYADLVQRKIAWASCSVRCLLQKVAPTRRGGFQDIYDSWLFALQCRDDVEDASEDTITYQTAVTEALRMTPAALLAAGPKVVAPTITQADGYGFHRLARYLERWLALMHPWLGNALPPEVDRDATLLAAAWEKRTRLTWSMGE